MARIRVGDSEVTGDGRIDEIMKSSGHNPDAYLFIMEGVPVPDDMEVSGDEFVDAIRVASGG